MEQGFKLVRRNRRGKLVSIAAPAVGIVIYEPGVWTEPNMDCGPLSLFRRECFAGRFYRSAYGPEQTDVFIIPCDYEAAPLSNDGLWIKNYAGDYRAWLRDEDLPTGTVLASRVRLLRPDPNMELGI